MDDWIEEYGLATGDFDVTVVDKDYTDEVPTDIQMGKGFNNNFADNRKTSIIAAVIRTMDEI